MSTPYDYLGWTITFNAARPFTGRWRADRHGVGMCNNSEESIRRMVEVKRNEERERREAHARD